MNNGFELNRIKTIAIDLDGVVYQGDALIAGADISVDRLREMGFGVVFVTNGEVKSRFDIADKLKGMGILTGENEVLTSSYMAGCLIKKIGGLNQRVFVVGAKRLSEEITFSGSLVVTEPPIDIVVVGMDVSITYQKIHRAMEAIIGGAIFIACNRDANFPSDNGRLFPGCGSMVAAIESATGFPPEYVAGKPSVYMLEIIAERYGLRPDEILVIGDGIDSDIQMAILYGSPSVLINSRGISGRKLKLPTFVMSSLIELPVLLGRKND